MSVAVSDSMPIRVSSNPLAPGAVVRGHEGFMKLNMQLDFVNRSPTGRKLSVVARSFGPSASDASTARRPAFTAGPAISPTAVTCCPSSSAAADDFNSTAARRAPVRQAWRSGPRKPQRQRAAFARRQHCLDHLHGPCAAGAAARRDTAAAAALPVRATIPACACSMPISRRCSRCEQEWDLALVDAAYPRPRPERARRARRRADAGSRTRRACGAADRRTRGDPRTRL